MKDGFLKDIDKQVEKKSIEVMTKWVTQLIQDIDLIESFYMEKLDKNIKDFIKL